MAEENNNQVWKNSHLQSCPDKKGLFVWYRSHSRTYPAIFTRTCLITPPLPHQLLPDTSRLCRPWSHFLDPPGLGVLLCNSKMRIQCGLINHNLGGGENIGGRVLPARVVSKHTKTWLSDTLPPEKRSKNKHTYIQKHACSSLKLPGNADSTRQSNCSSSLQNS